MNKPNSSLPDRHFRALRADQTARTRNVEAHDQRSLVRRSYNCGMSRHARPAARPASCCGRTGRRSRCPASGSRSTSPTGESWLEHVVADARRLSDEVVADA